MLTREEMRLGETVTTAEFAARYFPEGMGLWHRNPHWDYRLADSGSEAGGFGQSSAAPTKYREKPFSVGLGEAQA